LPIENALDSLSNATNQEIDWAIGDLLRERAVREDWRNCPILQHLETGAQNLTAWNELFRRTRQALAEPNALARKARILLRPDSLSFDVALEDFIAEMLAAQYLFALGHENIRLLSDEEPITTDLMSVENGITYVTEAKNLREPLSLAYVAFSRWHRNHAADPGAFNFTVSLLEFENPFEDLTPAQATAVRNLVDTLPRRPRPSEFRVTLPEDRVVRVRVDEGRAAMVQHGPGPFLVNEVVEDCQRAIVSKLLEPSRKALTQLYAPAVPRAYRKLLFVRWKPPDAVLAIGEADRVRTAVQNEFQAFIREFFDNFAVVILHTGEGPENTPRATWR